MLYHQQLVGGPFVCGNLDGTGQKSRVHYCLLPMYFLLESISKPPVLPKNTSRHLKISHERISSIQRSWSSERFHLPYVGCGFDPGVQESVCDGHVGKIIMVGSRADGQIHTRDDL